MPSLCVFKDWRPGAAVDSFPVSAISIPLPEEDLAFLRDFAEASGTSAEALLARQSRRLREHLQRPLGPDVTAASGIVDPEVDARQAHREHLEGKHGV